MGKDETTTSKSETSKEETPEESTTETSNNEETTESNADKDKKDKKDVIKDSFYNELFGDDDEDEKKDGDDKEEDADDKEENKVLTRLKYKNIYNYEYFSTNHLIHQIKQFFYRVSHIILDRAI